MFTVKARLSEQRVGWGGRKPGFFCSKGSKKVCGIMPSLQVSREVQASEACRPVLATMDLAFRGLQSLTAGSLRPETKSVSSRIRLPEDGKLALYFCQAIVDYTGG